MQWLAWPTALIAAGIAIPALIALYILKLRRTERVVSSTFLWKRAARDLQVNAPFRRLRKSLLLLLQLLVLLAVLAALGRPTLKLTAGPGRKVVILIDRSASMNATDAAGKGTRLDEAKAQARTLIESLRTGGGLALRDTTDQAMVIAFDARAKVLCNFTSDRSQLLAAVEGIEPTDGGSLLDEALTVARAFAQSAGVDANNRSATQRAQLALFSDGRIDDLTQLAVAEGELTYHRMGRSQANVGVVAMQARRSYNQPDRVDVFASLANYADAIMTVDVQLSLNGNVAAVRSVEIPARKPPQPDRLGEPGLVTVSFELKHEGAGVVEVRQMQADALACDNAAWAVVYPPKRLSALLVTRGNAALEAALKSCPLARLDVISPAQFDALDVDALSAAPTHDVIVLDGYAPAKLPRGRFLVFGRPPKGFGASAAAGVLTNQVIVDWRSQHPVLQFVDLGGFFAARGYKLSLPRQADVLAEFDQTPAIALLRKGPSVMLLAGFDVMETNWPFEPTFVMFCYNAMQYLGLDAGLRHETGLAVGAPLLAEGLGAEVEATVTGPQGEKKLRTDSAGKLRFPATHRAGVYRLAVEGRKEAFYAVNLLDARESDIAPAERIEMSGRVIQARDEPVARGNVELWPYLALLALVLVCAEWFVYNSKLRL